MIETIYYEFGGPPVLAEMRAGNACSVEAPPMDMIVGLWVVANYTILYTFLSFTLLFSFPLLSIHKVLVRVLFRDANAGTMRQFE